MKKTLIAFAIGSLFLTACESSAPQKNSEDELSPGLMQPVEGSGAQNGSYGWEAIQPASMPASMK